MAGPRPAREPLPSELNTASGSLAFLEVGKDKLTVRYNGPAQHDNDVGSIQANHPAPRKQLLYYFEATVKEASGGSIAIGFSDCGFKQGRHPGRRLRQLLGIVAAPPPAGSLAEPHSYGYRGDTGRKHHSSLPARGEEYGPGFGPGDVVGAGIHLTRHEIFFTKNGQHLGTAFRGVSGHPLFPTLGLRSQGACVEVNFGRRPFQFDVAALAARERQQQAEAMESASRVSAGQVHHIIRGYLLHYGYAQSLAAFDAAAGMAALDEAGGNALAMSAQAGAAAQQQQRGPAASNGMAAQLPGEAGANGQAAASSSDAAALASLPLRARLRQLLMSGDTAAARQLLQEQAPDLLAAPQPAAGGAAGGAGPSGSGTGGSGGSSSSSFELQFHLACQQYIELIRRGDIAAALACAEGTLSTLRGASPQHDALLRDVVALIAYQQPEQSPLAPLLAPAQREATADVVNAALLRSRSAAGGREPQAALELVLRQLTAVQHELHELAGGHGPEFDLQEHLPQPAGGPQAALQAAQQQQQQQQQQQLAAAGGHQHAQQEGGPEPMATE